MLVDTGTGPARVGSTRPAASESELHEPERIAGRRDVQALERVSVEWRTGRLRHEVRRLAAVEPAQLENVEVGAVEQRGLPGPNCDEDGDRIGDQPPDREQECSSARVVEPVGIVEEDQHRLVVRHRCEQAQRRRPNGEPLTRRAGLERERSPERVGLRPRDRPEAAERRTEQLQQPAERHPRFGLDPAGLEDDEPIRRSACLLQERRLADPRLADHREDRAHPGPCVREQPVERLPLPLAPEEHGHPV